ncbi:glycosyltransferase [Microbacterium proteolyticum]|uniref:glycosyltransferase n=1 Tax=Microbacterium proteolyticum TaxID=1572644 RepID=UPI0024172873|nr:glycosyltransferase [Microbacterium proteolyticum]
MRYAPHRRTPGGPPIDATAPRRIRVAAVPAGHPYTRAITDERFVDLRADPPPPGAAPGQWWPPQVLLPEWLDAHADEIDVVHVHFGSESSSTEELSATVSALRRLGLPLVYTVHDLENPQLTDQGAHRAALAVLLAGADEVTTLTAPTAAEVERDYGRVSVVIPHPTLADGTALPVGRPHAGTRVGVHLRDLRPNIDGVGTVATLVRAVADLRARGTDIEAVVRLNENVRDPDAAASIHALADGTDGVTVERAARLDDDALAAWLADLDVCLLPYSHGTHSGWAELCYDLAVPVVGTRVGHVAAQHPADFHAFRIGDPVSLERAIVDATAGGWSVAGSDARGAEVARRRVDRLDERERVRQAHVAVYRRSMRTEHAA